MTCRAAGLGLVVATLVVLGGCGARTSDEVGPESGTGAPSLEVVSNGGRYRVIVEPSPDALAERFAAGEPVGFDVRVATATGDLPKGIELSVDAAMPDHRHGLNVDPVVSGSAEEGFRVEGLLLHMPGYWEIYFDVTRDAFTERAQVVVER